MAVANIVFLCIIIYTNYAVFGTNANAPVDKPRTALEQVIETFHEMREDAVTIREDAVTIREEAHKIRQEGYAAMNKAYQVKEDAYEVKDEAYETRSELESLLIDTFALLKSQTTSSSLYIQEIRNSLTAINNRMGNLESRIEGFEDQIEELKGAVGNQADQLKESVENQAEQFKESVENQAEQFKGSLDQTYSQLTEKVEESIALSTLAKSRLQAWMSEVRLISLFKMADMNKPHSTYGTGVVTDGQFIMSHQVHSYMRTHCHSDNTQGILTNNKLQINLGGLFRIHRVYIWNYRNCCLEQLVGTHIYADESLLGTVIEASVYHDFKVSEGNPTYASQITLHQPLQRNIHVLEVQVWGSGPFNEDDLFA